METSTGMSATPQAVVAHRASRDWFVAFWAVVVLWIGLIAYEATALYSVGDYWGEVSLLKFALILAVPTSAVTLVAFLVHWRLRYNSTTAKAVLAFLGLATTVLAIAVYTAVH